MTADVNLIVVCGATASGKTRLGVELARRYDGEIISVDSRQVYRGLDIGSGKDLDEYITPDGPVPYHLIDIVDPQQVYSLWNYLEDFDRVFGEVTARDRLPVAVGGTGLYLEAVLRGYARRETGIVPDRLDGAVMVGVALEDAVRVTAHARGRSVGGITSPYNTIAVRRTQPVPSQPTCCSTIVERVVDQML